MNELIARGNVESLCLNGSSVEFIQFDLNGPKGDKHSSSARPLSGHDTAYRQTSGLKKGDPIFNLRSWTALSREELVLIDKALGTAVPQGCLLENVTLVGIPNFSKLAPTSRLVFPWREHGQAILYVTEENSPCHVVGERLANHYGIPDLQRQLIKEAQNKRGVMGIVYSAGYVEVGDEVLVYPPVQ